MFTILDCFKEYLPRIHLDYQADAKADLAKLNALQSTKDAKLNEALIAALCEKPYWRCAIAFVLDENADLAKQCQDQDKENNFFTQLLENFVIFPDKYPEFRLLPLEEKISSYNIFLGVFWFNEMLRTTNADKIKLYCLKAIKYQNIRAVFFNILTNLEKLKSGVDYITQSNLENSILLSSEKMSKHFEFSGNLLYSYCALKLAEFHFKHKSFERATELYGSCLFAFYWAYQYSTSSETADSDSIKSEIHNIVFTTDHEDGEKKILALFFQKDDWFLIEKSLINGLWSSDDVNSRFADNIKNEVATKFAEVHRTLPRLTCS